MHSNSLIIAFLSGQLIQPLLFTSLLFLGIFAVAVVLNYYVSSRYRWLYLLVLSYLYYMSWTPVYVLLLLGTTVVVYFTAIMMHGKSTREKKLWCVASLMLNLGMLVVFKYSGFLARSMVSGFDMAGVKLAVEMPKLIMPLGISFYTFQALGYTIDVYRGTREPERHFGIFALFVSFFPLILSGPIERSTTLMPQFRQAPRFDYKAVTDGMKLMAWGFFQKMVIADRLTVYVNQVFANPRGVDGLPLLVAMYFFIIQIYCDFSGYSDIAIGASKMLGYDVMPNFRRPFFAPTLNEFWRRWHMSLISWFRDYLYIPLGGNRVAPWRLNLNLMIIFVLSGIWHGANWTFVVWGALNGLIVALSRKTLNLRERVHAAVIGALRSLPRREVLAVAVIIAACGGAFLLLIGGGGGPGAVLASLPGAIAAILPVPAMAWLVLRDGRGQGVLEKAAHRWRVFVTFHLFVFSGVFFRVQTVGDGIYFLTHFPGMNFSAIPIGVNPVKLALMFAAVLTLFAVHAVQERGSITESLRNRPAALRWALYVLLCATILMLGYRGTSQFIYFQF